MRRPTVTALVVLRWVLAIGALATCVAPSAARADFFSSSPGPLAAVHAALDAKDRCQDCHVGARGLSADKCLVCHAAIGDRQRQRKGLHGGPKAVGKPCELCHTDHQGRARDILGWQAFGGAPREGRFDHAGLTGFALDGRHQAVACKSCHAQKTASGAPTYLKAPVACIGCHANPHGELREPLKRCERCHDARSWSALERPQFDHDRDARYPLERKHEGVTCWSCHARTATGQPPRASGAAMPNGPLKLTFRWSSWSTDCAPCHDNVHGASLFGQKACRLCHSAKVEFSRISFDHNRRTHFALDGAHAKPTCVSCHAKDERRPPDRRCAACHPDVHQKRFDKVSGGDCGVCHAAANWPTDLKLDHGARTRFALTGAHAQADCRACHRGKGPTEWEHLEPLIKKSNSGSKTGTQVQCMGCHQHSAVHNRQYTDDKCLDCHKMAGVLENKPRAVNEFHGAGSRFPLTEGHKGVACGKCHPGDVFTNTPTQCGPRCHPDQLHKGTLGADCRRCHTGGRWEARLFDHDTQTRWPLVGNHRDVLCEGCHPRRDFAANRGLGKSCVNCHARDDAHAGQLGRRCETCHNPDGKLTFEHNDARVSDWPLVGKHQSVRCAACHKSIQFRPTPRDCGGCHPEPPVHRGQLGTLCGVCHDALDWKNVRTGHDVPSPRFGGAHDRVPCAQCHPGGRLLAGTGQLCITCHRNDDIHHNALGPRCGECHTQRSFAGARFEHTRVGCELVGVHRLLPCVDCHVGGNFTALAPECGACHRKDAIRGAAAAGAPPNHASLTLCASCHNPNFFGPASKASGRESVCR